MRSVTRLLAEKFDESCPAYRYNKAMNFTFGAKQERNRLQLQVKVLHPRMAEYTED